MPSRKRRILTIGLSVEEFDLVAPCLDPGNFDVDRFPSAHGALELIACHAVEVLLVRHPLPGMDLEPFLRAVRDPGSPSRRSPLLLLTPRRQLADAEGWVGRGANRVVAIDGDAQALQATVTDLLDVAPRKPCNFIAQLRIRTGHDDDWILCRTCNGSASGVLLETDRRVPPGTRVEFEFTLPSFDRPIVGRGEVTRHTLEGRDPVAGMGMRFLSFAGDSGRSFQEFLNGRS